MFEWMPHAFPNVANVSRFIANCKSMPRFNVINYSIRYLSDSDMIYSLSVLFFFQFWIEMLLAHSIIIIIKLDSNWFKFRQTASFDSVLETSAKYQYGSIWLMNHEWRQIYSYFVWILNNRKIFSLWKENKKYRHDAIDIL